MHTFYELAFRCTHFSLSMINEAESKSLALLSETGSTPPIKNLQALNLQRMIHVVGMFSVFEAHLQRRLSCSNGFKEAEKVLENAGEFALKEDFHNCYLAVNALKHGQGSSYKILVNKIHSVPFVVGTPSNPIFEEGDVTGIEGLIKVDDSFLESCLQLIENVSEKIALSRPDFNP